MTTLDQTIEKLTELKQVVGGDVEVKVWLGGAVTTPANPSVIEEQGRKVVVF